MRKVIRGAKILIHAICELCRPKNRKKNLLTLVIFSISAFCLTQFLSAYLADIGQAAFWWSLLVALVRWSWIPAIVLFLMTAHGEVSRRRAFENFFYNQNFWGFDGKIPEYVKKYSLNRHIEILRFRSRITESEWQKIRETLEMYLLKKVYKIRIMEDMSMTEIFVIEQELERYTAWDDTLMKEGSLFAIGEGYEGEVVWDADALNHGVIAGSTNTGKTNMLRLLGHQAIFKKWNVSIIDMKNGGDYHAYKDIEQGYGNILVNDAQEVHDLLLALTIEVKSRLKYFDEAGVSNLQEYNVLEREPFESPRQQFLNWLVIIDEAAELLDVRPKDKAEKQMYDEIDSYLRTLARTSRAAGLHLVLGYIRPSADVLDGQIKNNLLWRVCGYFADDAASRIVLDNDKATELPPEVKGRFVIGQDVVQAYFLRTRAEVAR